MGIAELHRRAVDGFLARVEEITDGQWEAPTPCPGWSVRDLVQHVTDGNRVVAPVLAGQAADDGGDLSVDELRLAARKAGAGAAAAIAADGALDGMKHPPHGSFPGEVYAYQRLTENLIHSWDLARAIRADERLDDDLVTACTGFFDQAEDLYRQAGFVGPAARVASGADPQTSLLARFGRRV